MPRYDARPSTPPLPSEGANDVLRQVYTEVQQLQPHSRRKASDIVLAGLEVENRLEQHAQAERNDWFITHACARLSVHKHNEVFLHEVFLHDTCARTRTHTCTHTHTHTYTHTYTLTHSLTYARTHTVSDTHTHTHSHTCTHTRAHTHMHTHTHTHTHSH